MSPVRVRTTGINEYLTRQPGCQWRPIVVQDDGTILDVVAYESIVNARAGAAGITGEMGDSLVRAAIDHSSVDWQMTTVLQHIEETTRTRPAGDVLRLAAAV